MSIDLEKISEEELLNTRICDLPVQIEGTWLQECITQLYQELDAKSIVFKPPCYLADEWLTPENEPVIGIPFYLAHPSLIKLEKKMMLEAEGETKNACMQLLRHEAGHALCYAYQLNKLKSWQKIFGYSTETYGDTYRYQPYSKRFVRHLDGFYAQYHPDEDFVESFAVWLTPGSDWQNKYKGWKAIDKLNYVDELMREVQHKKPAVSKGRKFWNVKSLKITLNNHYKKKRRLVAEDFPDFHDARLLQLFKPLSPEEFKDLKKQKNEPRLCPAQDIIKKYKTVILNAVTQSTGERKYIINDLLKTIVRRCGQLRLAVAEQEGAAAAIQISIYITSLIMNYVYTGWFKGEDRRK